MDDDIIEEPQEDPPVCGRAPPTIPVCEEGSGQQLEATTQQRQHWDERETRGSLRVHGTSTTSSTTILHRHYTHTSISTTLWAAEILQSVLSLSLIVWSCCTETLDPTLTQPTLSDWSFCLRTSNFLCYWLMNRPPHFLPLKQPNQSQSNDQITSRTLEIPVFDSGLSPGLKYRTGSSVLVEPDSQVFTRLSEP